MKRRNYFISCMMVFFIIGILLNIISVVIYPLDVDNCQEILKQNSLATNDDAIRCIKIINQPIYSYYIPEILGCWILSFFTVVIFGSLIFVFLEETGRFDNDYSDVDFEGGYY